MQRWCLLTIVFSVAVVLCSGCGAERSRDKGLVRTSRPRPLLQEYVHHTMRIGETLDVIASAYSVSIDDIVRANYGISRFGKLTPGKVLTIPGVSGKPRPLKPIPVVEPVRDEKGFVWPVKGRLLRRFGVYTEQNRTYGINIQTSDGAKVAASASGRVLAVSKVFPGLGKTVILEHGRDEYTLYAHMREILVEAGI